MSDGMRNATEDLFSSLEDPRNKNAVQRIQEVDPVLNLRSGVVKLLQGRIDMVSEVEEMRRQIRTRMMNLSDSLSFDQLERLHNLLGADARQSSDSVIGIFKSAPGAPSPLGEIMRERNTNEEEKNAIASTLSAEKLQMVEKFFIAVSKAAEEMSSETPPEPTENPRAPDLPSISIDDLSLEEEIDGGINEDQP